RLGWYFQILPGAFRERLVQAATLPARKSGLDAELAARREAYRLSLVRERVGRSRVDFFGIEHGIILLNQLKYSPRPVNGGSYNAYTPWLMERDQDFLRDATRAPGFYLIKPQTIDGRILAQDDALAFREIVQRYVPLLIEQGYILAERR